MGLASRGNTHCRPEDVEHAVERGINYLNWCGKPDGLSKAIAGMEARRKDVVVAVQFKASSAEEAAREFDWILEEINSDYLDIATFYYVESESEWEAIIGPGGAWGTLAQRKREGTLKMIGLTSHQRKLAAKWAEAADPEAGEKRLDMLMIRYNAAHRGAEDDVFPLTDGISTPVVTFTGLRWKGLLEATPDDPEDFAPPTAAECYRFCLAHDSVSVALMAAGNREELDANLTILDDWRPPSQEEMNLIRQHGDRVRKHGREFW